MRSSSAGELNFDPEIEKTAKRLRKEARQRKAQASSSVPPLPDTTTEISDSSLDTDSDVDMAEHNAPHVPPVVPAEQTLRELAAPPVDQQPLCIRYPPLRVPFELKSGLIQLLPKFHGVENEDPNKHLKEFHIVCSSFMPQGISEDQVKLRAFPFSLDDRAKDWLFYLPPGSVDTWTDMVQLFLERFFPASRAANLRREICSIKQNDLETLYEYWERFKRLCASCPQHGVSEQLLIQYFYDGLLPLERRMMDAASGGAIISKTPREAQDLISVMASNSQQFNTKTEISPRRVNEVSTKTSEFEELTSLLRQTVSALNNNTPKMPRAIVCGICGVHGHLTDSCPSLTDEDSWAQLNAVNNFGGQYQKRHDPYSNTYNPGWRDHPNLRYGNGPQHGNYQQ